MKTKWKPREKTVKNKPVPDGRVYLTKDGQRVRISKTKQFPVGNCTREWEKELREKLNEEYEVVRISDGHVLWGYKPEDLTPL